MASTNAPKRQGPAGLRTLEILKTKTEACSKAFLILRHTHKSSRALLTAYDLARTVRALMKGEDRKPVLLSVRGMSTDEEQDLLRAMLVTAASGLDSMTKQLIRDALPDVLKVDKGALSKLEEFVRRKLKRDIEDESWEGSSFLARVLAAPSTQTQVIENYIDELTKGSLQSSQELERVASALGLQRPEMTINHNILNPIFDARNKIIHELDIDLYGERRKRNLRNEPDMTEYANTLIELGEKMLQAVDQKLSKKID